MYILKCVSKNLYNLSKYTYVTCILSVFYQKSFTSIKMEMRSNHNKAITKDKDEPPFGKREDMIALLNALFKYGYSNLPSSILPNMSKEERHSALQSTLEQAKIAVNKKSSIIDWLNSDIFGNDEYGIPLALLLIGLYEQYPSSEQRNKECNFRYDIEKIF